MSLTSRLFSGLSRGVFVVALPLFLVSGAVAIAINCQPLYEYGFARYDVGQTTGLSAAQLDSVARQIIDYFDSASDGPIAIIVPRDGQQVALFNSKEIAHMVDVKNLIRFDYEVLLVTLLLAVAYGVYEWRRRQTELAISVMVGSGLSLALLLGLGLMASLNFDQFFWQFHLIAFSNDFWQLDPATDYLIRLFPEPFWSDATLFVGLLILVGALAFGVAGWLLLRPPRPTNIGLS